jgi:flavin reductase (DIM6/NTAB) family NADH-FMN oxidoreductase RutF
LESEREELTGGGKAQEIQDSLKEAMRGFPQGVTVVTTNVKGRLWGVTVSSFTTLSLKPPLILVSLMKNVPSSRAIASASGFTVNFLADDQRLVSDRFAGRMPLEDRFEGLHHQSTSKGYPLIEGATGYLYCKRWRNYDGGDHVLILGKVVEAKRLNQKPPLVHFRQQYTTVVPPVVGSPAGETLW